MTHIPATLLTKWRRNSTARSLGKLECLLEYRDVLAENTVDGKNKIPIELLEREAAAAMLISESHLRHAIGTIREYSEAQLHAWILKGVSFDHIARANSLSANVSGALPPAGILDLAILVGGADGKTMTVTEMTACVLGEHQMRPAQYSTNILLSKVANLATNWPSEKRTAFKIAWDNFIEEWFS